MISALVFAFILLCGATSAQERITWRECLSQKQEWYGSEEALRIAENVLLYQRASGGWPKNQEMAALLSAEERAALAEQRGRQDSTIDNGATYRQMAYLARVHQATLKDRFRDAFLKGLEFLLRAQYANGGWPQVYPNPSGYSRHITFNDNAMVGVLSLLREIARGAPEYRFVDKARRARAETAVQRGIDCILKCQIRVEGKLTAWCAQHDERTLAPAPARSYEKMSLSGAESAGIVRFLMGIEKPPPAVVEAVEAAIAWFEAAKLTGIRQVNRPDASLPGGYDKMIVPDPTAPPLWARFYEIGSNRPIFCGRDGVIKHRLADIEHERRTGYAWYTTAPAALWAKEYPVWKARWGVRER